ncbi:hypothetical protein TRAPUB_9747 [Trametes pubescens]|uniref:Uncharacterized protein n=1 Tax=Trametes pubescens TaxID=154538 RepID=A0A1M2W1I3_TRAPU|nr:hypothetical protein TRAPUB_9747 [Trametes pubescens]
MSHAEKMHWIAPAHAELTFVGDRVNLFEARWAQKTMIIHCSSRVGNACGGQCNAYNGGAMCLAAPDVNCFSATMDIGFCNQASSRRGGICTELVNSIQQLSNKFCRAPN